MNASTSCNVSNIVQQTLCEHRMLADADRVLVGLSGGSDSVALLLLLRELCDLKIVAVHLHHGLRPEDADADAGWCAQFCAEHNVGFECHHLRVPSCSKPGESIEQAARRCRLTFWEECAEKHDVVALGHHLDDCLENLLLRLGRGANSTGLTGLRELSVLGGVRFIRPLLSLRKQDLREYLGQHGVKKWRHDHTNDDYRHRRNAIRHSVLPALTAVFGSEGGLLMSLQNLRQDADCLEQMSEEFAESVGRPGMFGRIPPALQPRALRIWLREKTGDDAVPRSAAVERVREELARDAEHPRVIPLGQGLSLTVDRAGLHVTGQIHRLDTHQWHWDRQHTLPLPSIERTLTAERLESVSSDELQCMDANSEYFAADSLPSPLTVRAWEPGDRIIPFGHATQRKVKDVFIDAGIPSTQRRSHPVVAAGSILIWIPGIRRANVGAVSSSTVPCIKLTCSRTGS